MSLKATNPSTGHGR